MSFYHTPEEALVEDRVKACVGEEINSVIKKIWTIVSYIIIISNRMRSLHVLEVGYILCCGCTGWILFWWSCKEFVAWCCISFGADGLEVAVFTFGSGSVVADGPAMFEFVWESGCSTVADDPGMFELMWESGCFTVADGPGLGVHNGHMYWQLWW